MTDYQNIQVQGPQIKADTTLSPGVGDEIIKRQQTMAEGAQWSNIFGQFANLGLEAFKTNLQGNLMNRMIDFSMAQMAKYYDLQDSLVGLNGKLIGSQEKVALASLKTQKEIAELNFDYKKVETKARADAAVRIAKVNALNAQFYGQPNKLPSLS